MRTAHHAVEHSRAALLMIKQRLCIQCAPLAEAFSTSPFPWLSPSTTVVPSKVPLLLNLTVKDLSPEDDDFPVSEGSLIARQMSTVAVLTISRISQSETLGLVVTNLGS
jgi:hypothetical protein